MIVDFQNCKCQDYLKDIPDNNIDLILIDPPYIVSRDTNFSSGKPTGRDVDRFRMSMDFGEWDRENDNELPDILKECYRVLKKSGTIISFYDLWKITYLKEWLENAKFKQIRFIEWLKTNPVPINSKTNYLTNAREIAVLGVKGKCPTYHSEYDNGIYRYPICHTKDRFHPTQKPIELMEELIKKHSNEEDIVLDCFAGSCSTGIAALKNNRNFIGCEQNEEYYEKANKRLQEFIINNNIEVD